MANNQYVNKVQKADGTVLIDISSDTVTAGSMLSGTTAHDKSGAPVTGNIATKTSSDMTVSGKTVTAPAGYYASAQSKDVATGTITNNTSGGTSSGTINRGSQIKIGTGYYSSDKYYTAQANSGTKTISSSGTISVDGYANVSVAAGSITNNTSGGTSSGTINRGNQIKIGAGYYSSDKYYTAQSNSGTLTITSSGTTSVDGYANVNVPSGAIVVSVSATSNTSKTINNSAITADHYVYNKNNPDAGSDITWTTSAGSITLSCSSGIPAMELMLCLDI